jgi:hypothetical protein
MIPLSPPDDATTRPDAVEVLRGWIVGGGLQVSLAFEAFGNAPQIWGQLLAETAHHVADAMALQGYGDRAELFERIQSSLIDNLNSPEPGLHGTIEPPTQ